MLDKILVLKQNIKGYESETYIELRTCKAFFFIPVTEAVCVIMGNNGNCRATVIKN